MAKGKRIRGITIELGGDATGILGAVEEIDKKLKQTQTALKDTQRLLKLDPGNVKLLTQEQGQLNEAIQGTEDKLKALKDAAAQAEEQLASGKMSQAQFDALQREIIATEQDLKGLKAQMKDFGSVTAQQIAAAGEKVKDVGDKMTQVGTAMSKYVTAPIVGVGTAAVAAFNEVDESLDIIVKKTGASGKALEDMQARAKNLATSIPTDFATAGTAVGEVNTRFGLMGDELEKLSGQFIKFAELNDTDVSSSIDTVQAAMAAWNQGANMAGVTLNILNKAAQDTGVDVNKLAEDLTTNSAALQEMGFSIQGATGFLANLNKNGLDSSTVLTGMKKALQNATKDGKTMTQALAGLQKSIINAKSETKAMQAATEIFGAKAAPVMVKALREGRISFDDIANSVKEWGDSIDNTFEATQDPIDSFKTTLNELKIVGMELVEAAAPLIKTIAEGLRNAVSTLRKAWEGLSPQMQETIIKLAGVAAAVGPVLAVGGKIVAGIGTLMTLAPKLVSAFGTVKTAFAAVSAVLAANPIGAVIAGLVALGAGLVALYKNCEGFRNGVNAIAKAIWDTIRGGFENIKNLVANFGTYWANAMAAIKNGITNAVDWVRDGLGNIGSFFTNLGQSALDWGRDLIANFVSGIKQKWEDAKHAVSDFAGMIKDFLGFSEPKEGPLSNFHTFAPDMVDLFVKGLKDNQRAVANQLARTFGMPEATATAPAQAATGGAGGAGRFTVPIGGGATGGNTVVLTINGTEIGRVLVPYIQAEEQRMGVQLVRG